MTKTHFIDLIHTIGKTKSTWLAILIFIMTASAFHFGISWSNNMINASINRQFLTNNTRDIEFVSFTGFSNEAFEKIKNTDGVADAEKIRVTYGTFKYNKSVMNAEVREISERIDCLTLTEGEFPTSADEAVVDKGFAEREGLKIGDEITFTDNHLGEDQLSSRTFRITGIVINPAYSCSESGTLGYNLITGSYIDSIFYTVSDAFVSGTGYESILVTGSELSQYSFETSEYGDLCEQLSNKISEESGMPVGMFSMTRMTLGRMVSVNALDDIFDKLSYCLSLLFLVISILVSYVAITRLVYSQKAQTGMKKAFGLGTADVAEYYLFYTLTALVIGYIVGIGVGIVFEYIMGLAAGDIYYFDQVVLYTSAGDILILFAVLLCIAAAITIVASISVCRKDAIDLLNGNEDSRAKHHWYEKLHVWNRMSLLNRTIVNNCVTDKRRAIGTFISVAGCMALFVCAFTFNKNITGSIDVQFTKYFHFDTVVAFDPDNEDTYNSLQQTFADNDQSAIPVCFVQATLESEEHKYYETMIFVVPDGSNVSDFIEMEGHQSDIDSEFAGGIYAGHAYRNYYGNDSGDITFHTKDGTQYVVTPDEYFMNYTLAEYLVMSESAYESTFNKKPVWNEFLVKTDNASIESIRDEVGEIDGLRRCTDFIKSCSNDFVPFTAVVKVISYIYYLTAIIMAFLVLKNILSQFVLEKKKELIVMKLNGYEDTYLRRYILVDTVILTLIGIIPGAVIGSLAGYLSVCAFDAPTISLLKDINWVSWLVGFVFTAILSLINCALATRQINKFEVSDIN